MTAAPGLRGQAWWGAPALASPPPRRLRGECAPRGAPAALQGVWRSSGQPRPLGSTGPSSHALGPSCGNPARSARARPGRGLRRGRVASAQGACESPPRAPTDRHAACGLWAKDPSPPPQRRHVLRVRETPRGRRAAERAPRGQPGHPGAPRSGQVR